MWMQELWLGQFMVIVKFGVGNMHQGSGLMPLVFATVMEAISREFPVSLSWELTYVHDLVMIANSKEEDIRKRDIWRQSLEKMIEGKLTWI